MSERIDGATRDLYRPVPIVRTDTYLTQMRCPECRKLLSGVKDSTRYICQACGYERREDAAKVRELQRKNGYRSPGRACRVSVWEEERLTTVSGYGSIKYPGWHPGVAE